MVKHEQAARGNKMIQSLLYFIVVRTYLSCKCGLQNRPFTKLIQPWGDGYSML